MAWKASHYTHLIPLSDGNGVVYNGRSGALVKLSPGAREIRVQINVEKEYVRLIRTNTVFWRKMGISADLGLFGSKINIGSLESILKGGIALATPDEAGKIANAESTFSLAKEPPKKWEEWAPRL